MTPFERAQRFIGLEEIPGLRNHPLISWWLSLCGLPDSADEVPWCSAFVNGVAWDLRLPRSKSAAARSWLAVGTPVERSEAKAGWDVVVLKRGPGHQPGPEVISGAPGHVGFFDGLQDDRRLVRVLGGNQGNRVSLETFPADSILGIRSLRPLGNSKT